MEPSNKGVERVIEIFQRAHNLLDRDGAYINDGCVAKKRGSDGKMVSCVSDDPEATQFSLFGAIWANLPTEDQHKRAVQLVSLVKIFHTYLQIAGLDDKPHRNTARGHYNGFDAWPADRTKDEVLEALRLVIHHLNKP